MKYKAIMLDLDDTTVQHGIMSVPTPRVEDAIARAKDVIHVCVATGRPLDITLPIIAHLSLSGPCVINNGTIIYDPEKKKIIHEVFLPPESISPIYEVCQKEKLFVLIYNGQHEVEYTGGPITEQVMSMYIPQIAPDRVEYFMNIFAHISGIALHKLAGWDKKYLSIEITSADASKQHGILQVARLLGLKTEEIIGVGDGYNDFPLLMACGLKVAMGNAVPELKVIADFIAPSVDEDGVAVVLEKFVLGQ